MNHSKYELCQFWEVRYHWNWIIEFQFLVQKWIWIIEISISYFCRLPSNSIPANSGGNESLKWILPLVFSEIEGGRGGWDSVDFQSTEDPQSIRKNPAISDYAFATFRLQSIYPTWKFNPIPSIFFSSFVSFWMLCGCCNHLPHCIKMLWDASSPLSSLLEDTPSIDLPSTWKFNPIPANFTLLFHSSSIHHPEEEAADPSSQRFSLFSFENQIVMCWTATRSIGSIQRQLYHRQ